MRLTLLTEPWCGKSPWTRYGAALGAVLAVTLLRLPMEPLLHGRAPYALYYLVILMAAWHCGVGPTIAASAASAALAWIVFIPHPSGVFEPEAGYAASMVLFLLVCAGMIAMARAAVSVRRTAGQAVDAARRAQHAAKAAVWEWQLGAQPLEPSAVSRMLEIDPDSVLAPPEADRVLQALEAATRASGLFAVDFVVQHPRHGQRWLSATGAVVRSPFAQSAQVSGMTFDVTERKQAEQSRARLAAIVESSEDAIVSKTLDGIIQSWNASAERLFGYSADEIVGRPITVLIPPDRQNEEVQIIERLRRGERVDHFETVRVAKDGRTLDVSLTISPMRDEAGQITGASKIVRDITERKRAAAELVAQRERYRVTLESIGDAVIATNASGEIVFMNAVAEKLTGVPLAQAQGRRCAEVFRIRSEQTREPVEDPVARVLALGTSVAMDNHTVLLSADGHETPIDDSGAPIRGAGGEITGVVLVFRDVADRRRMDAERSAAQIERERLLESERAARGEAERANRMKDEFVASVSHELRTPLNAILGWTQLLVRPEPDEDLIARGIEVIDRNARVQAQLISDLLDISGIVAGKLRLDPQRVDLARIVRESIETVRPAAMAKSIEVRAEFDPALGYTIGDPTRLQQIAWNLLSNAVKFTPRGGRVEIALRRVGDQAELTVSDTGVGIRPEFLGSMFERFRQADPSTTRRYGGLGLGLSIVRHLVELHGGTVRASSEGEGRGATFVVELPIGEARGERRLTERFASGTGRDPDRSLEHVRVMLVEDEADARDLISRLLQEQQAEVITVSTAAEALRLLADQLPDVLVSDIGLPEMDGYEFIQRVRRLESEKGRNLPAIAVTAFARPQDRTRALQTGYHAHVSKPIEAAEFVALVANLAQLAAKPEA